MSHQMQQPDNTSVTKSAVAGGAALMGIGIATGAAALYLLRTERGRELSSDIRKTVSDSVYQLQERLSESISSVRNTIAELVDRWNTSSGSERPESENLSKLRRVI